MNRDLKSRALLLCFAASLWLLGYKNDGNQLLFSFFAFSLYSCFLLGNIYFVRLIKDSKSNIFPTLISHIVWLINLGLIDYKISILCLSASLALSYLNYKNKNQQDFNAKANPIFFSLSENWKIPVSILFLTIILASLILI